MWVKISFEKGGKGGFLSVSKSVTQIKMENEPCLYSLRK